MGGLDRRMPKELLDVIDGYTVVDQDGGKAVAQIVNPKIRQSSIPPGRVPRKKDGCVGSARCQIWEYKGVCRIMDRVFLEVVQEFYG